MAPPATNDPETLDLIFRGEIDGLFRYALRLLGSREEAEDAVQDAYLRIAVPREMPLHPRGFLFRVLRNICIDRLRSRTVRLRVVRPSEDIETLAQSCIDPRTPETDLIASDALKRVARAMDALPSDLADVLSLVVVESLSYRETAAVLGIPIGTVRSRLSRARDALRSTLNSTPESTEWHKASTLKVTP
jgi:RNA polymerase sigma-70 factor (ECF subfamily)